MSSRPRWRKVWRDLWLHKARTALVVLAIAVGILGAGAVLDTWSLLRRATRDEFRASNPAGATLRTEAVDAALLARVRALPAVAFAQARRAVTGSAEVEGEWRAARLFTFDDFSAISIGVVRPEAGAWPPADGMVVVERSSLDFARTGLGSTLVLQVGGGPRVALPVGGVARDVGLAPGWMDHVVYGFVTRATLARLGVPATLDELQIVAAPGRGDSQGLRGLRGLQGLGNLRGLRGLGGLGESAGEGDREAVRRVAYEVKRVVESTGRRVVDVDVPAPRRHVHAAQMDSLLFTQGAFGALALLLSGLLVFNLVTAMLAGQVREVGIMKALGARSGQIAAMYLGMALLLGLAACALAVPAAALAGRAYARFAADLLNFSLAGIAIPVPIVLLQIAVGALLPVAAAAIPVARGCRISVGAALRDLGIEPAEGAAAAIAAKAVVAPAVAGGPAIAASSHAARTGFALRSGLIGDARRRAGAAMGRPLLLALRNTFRRRQRLALTLATLSCGGAIYLGAINLRAAVAGSLDLLFAAQRFDLSVRFARPYPAQAVEAVAAGVPGVRRAEAWATAHAAVSRPDGTQGNTFSISAAPPASTLLAPTVERGRWLRQGDARALVVTRRLLEDEPALEPGRVATLLIEGRSATWQVVGVAEAGPTVGAYAPRQAVAAILSTGTGAVAGPGGAARPDEPAAAGNASGAGGAGRAGGGAGAEGSAAAGILVVAANSADPAAQLDLMQRLRAALADAGYEVQSGELAAQQRKAFEDHLLMVVAFLGVMGQLTILVGGLGLASTMSLAVLERTREIGVLRAIGARHRTIFAMVQVEALTIALLAWLAAIPLSVPMSVILGRAFGRIMFRVPLVLLPQAGGVLRWAVVAALVAFAAAGWPARRATRITTSAALAYE
jgi:putative ABC transport system permease protein